MSEKVNLSLRSYAKGLYEKAVGILAPGQCDDFSVISGSILLIVGLEKLVKSIIQNRNPLMVLLDKPTFDDLVDHEKGSSFANRKTISFEVALTRVIQLYPNLSPFQRDIKAIIDDRNLLMHNYGYLDISQLERNVQVRVADFTEALCRECLNIEPEVIIGQEQWNLLQKNRDAYINAECLELCERITHLKRLHSQGQPLPCPPIAPKADHRPASFTCPVCGQVASILYDIDWDVDVDHREGGILNVYPYATPEAMSCQCGFTLSTADEVGFILGDKKDELSENILNILYAESNGE